VLRVALARREALRADRETDSQPLLRHVTTTVDADEGFDAIAYAKGQLVLSTFESFIGPEDFKQRVRSYVKSRRGRSVTSDDVFSTIASGEQGEALKSYVASRGTPVVHFELRCQGKPELVANAPVRVPVCVTFGTGKGIGRTCALVGATTSIFVGNTCPAWVLGNPDGSYYHVGWRSNGPRGPAPPRGELTKLTRIITGDDLAAAVDRGELGAVDALAQLRDLADPRDVYAQLGSVALARSLDILVDDATRPAWTAWLAARFSERLGAEKKSEPADAELSRALISILYADQFASAITRRAHDLLDRLIPAAQGELPAQLVALAGAHAGDKLFDRIVARASVLRDPDVRDNWIESLGELGVAQVPKAVTLVVRSDLLPETTWLAVARFFARPATRTAAWRAVKAELPAIKRRVSADEQHQVMLSVAHLCDASSRREVAAAFRDDKDLTTTLQVIDRCIDRRARLGDLAAAIAASK
jgi:aminopeptidase N